MRLIRLLKRELAEKSPLGLNKKSFRFNRRRPSAVCMAWNTAKKQNRAYAILTVLGYLFVGLAAIVLIGHNWEDLSRELRMGGLLILTLGTQGIALKHYFSGRVAVRRDYFSLAIFFTVRPLF